MGEAKQCEVVGFQVEVVPGGTPDALTMTIVVTATETGRWILSEVAKCLNGPVATELARQIAANTEEATSGRGGLEPFKPEEDTNW
jgi:hypothetical protein